MVSDEKTNRFLASSFFRSDMRDVADLRAVW